MSELYWFIWESITVTMSFELGALTAYFILLQVFYMVG